MMKNKLKEYRPPNNLTQYIDSYWFFRNDTDETIHFPVVPDGCSDIIFYLNNSSKLADSDNTFVTGVMEFAELVPIPHKMELFGIRFQPGVLSCFLQADMSQLKNKRAALSEINYTVFQNLRIDHTANNDEIIAAVTAKLEQLLAQYLLSDVFFTLMAHINKNPDSTIGELSSKCGYSIRSIERLFNRRVGVSPKKFMRVIRFQKAHKKISKEGLADLVTVALSSGYFDQAHFNREYKKLVGFNPSHEILSILYNTPDE